MDSAPTLHQHLRRPATWIAATLLSLALAVMLGSGLARNPFGAQRAAIPFPSLVYRIEATSNGRTASIANLPIGYVGAPQVPIPVDVDGDLLPDVLVSVNLLDTQGLHNPPQPGDIIRPNIEINRYPLDLANVLLGQNPPPLRIAVALDINDLQGQQPKMTAKFGYDTAGGGSIPGYFQATVDGIQNFLNPVTATISTKGDIITQSSSPLWYRGPLTVIGGFQQGSFNADLGLKYSPFPDKAVVTYSRDAAGSYIDYSHDYQGEVDLLTNATITDAGKRTEVAARIDRLPRTIGVDLLNEADGGGIRYDSTADGRLPDVDVTYRGPLNGDVYNARLKIEQLPATMEAHWKMPKGGPASARFDASGQGIGAIEADITNKDGNPQGLPPFAFNEQQVLALQHNSSTGGIRLGGRIERIRHADVAEAAGGGLSGTINAGDGELPLQLAAFLDLRSTGAPLIDANATLSPLPSGPQPGRPTFQLKPAGADQQVDPLTISYSSLESVDIDGRILVRDAKSPTSGSAATDPASCGTTGVVCSNLRIRNIPTSLVTKIGSFKSATNAKRELRVDVDADGPGRTDVFGDVRVGPGIVAADGTPLADTPLVAQVDLLGIAKHASVRTIEGQDDTLQRAEFHTCDFDYAADACTAATKDDQIGALKFSLSNFLPEQRNDPTVNVPSAYAATPNFATITARGRDNGNRVAFEATGRIQSIRELTYVNDGAFGVRTDVGDNQPLSVLVDVKDIALNGADGKHRANRLYDVGGDVLIKPLPRKMSFCFNEAGQEIVSPTSTITAPCQDKNPFSTDANKPALAKSPLSFAYDGRDGNGNPQQIDEVLANGTIVDKGADASVQDDRTVKGRVDVTNIPATLRAHFLDPKGERSGPMKLLVDAPVQGEQLKVVASAAMLDADLQCSDPRVPASGKGALCATATLENIPTRVSMDYDPTSSQDNFVVDTAGDKQLNLKGLSVSSVSRDDSTGLAKVLLAEGQVLGIPKKLAGTLKTPAPDRPDDPVLVDLTATPALGSIDATVRNFIAPNPIPGMAAQRNGLPAPTDTASFIQRGDAFQGELHISGVKRVGFKNQVDSAGKKLDTNVLAVDFGADKIIRGYVDLDPDGINQTLADVTLTDVPAGLELCFRGAKPRPGTAAVPTFCDQQDPALGAFEARMSPVDGPKELDVNAFVRLARGGGTSILAGKLDVQNIPNVVRGTFGDGKVDIGGYTLAGVAEGIDKIAAHAASFDIPDDGWDASTRPYQPRFVLRAPFPAPRPSGEHVSLRADDTDFEASAQIGPQSQLHRIRVGDQPCAKPVAIDYDGDGNPDADYGARPDFPFFPTDDATKYTCVRGDFKPTGSTTVDPLALSVVVQKGGKVITLDDAQLSDIPEFFQVNLADANPLVATPTDRRLRPTCVGQGLAQPAGCVAPLVRFDNPGNSVLSGVASLGTAADLARLAAVTPREALPPDLVPTSTWSDDGIRARVGSFADSTAVRVALRLPIPASVTVDQVGTWSFQDLSSKANYRDASDLHFRFAARGSDGTTVDNLGRMSALVHSFSDGSQVLLSSADPNAGVEIPGEAGIDMYSRNQNGSGRNFFQIDGRSSASDLSMRARLLGTGASPLGRLDAQIRDVPPMPSLAYSPSTDPSFRIRAEVMGDGKEPPDSAGSDAAGASGGEPPKQKDCSPLLCVLTQVRVKSVNIQFDFKPDGATKYARLVEAAVSTSGAKNGVQVRAKENIDGTGQAALLAGAQVVVDPLNIFVHAGIPLLASFDFTLLSNLDAAFSIGGDFASPLWGEGLFDPSGDNVPLLSGPGSSDFWLRQNLVKINAQNSGPPGSFSKVGPIDFNVGIMHGEAWALFVKLIGVDFVPPGGTLRMPFYNCKTAALFGTDREFTVPDGLPGDTSSIVAWPFETPPLGNIVYSGVLGGPATIVSALAKPFFCLVSTDQTLINDDPNDPHPSDPLGVAQTLSAVPGAKEKVVDVSTPPTSPPSPALADLTVSSSTPPLCGTFGFRNITVPAGVTIRVADAPNTLDVNGNPDVATDEVPAACSPDATAGQLTLVAAKDVTVAGTVDASALVTSGTAASGNGGGGHGFDLFGLFGSGKGGDGGRSGTGGPRYGSPFDPLVSEAGTPGSALSGGGAAGLGGGVVTIIGDVLDVQPGGQILADGTDGGDVSTDTAQCKVDDDPGTTNVDESKPNTGAPGGGAGSGGGIVINVADYRNAGVVRAGGGQGGDGAGGAGGGGAGGNIKVSTALLSGDLPTAKGGAPGADPCGNFASAGAGEDGNVQQAQAPKSRIDISGDPSFGFWHSTAEDRSLTLPYSAAAAAGANGDMSVVLCATSRDAYLNLPDGAALSTALLPAQPTGASVSNPCGDVAAAARAPYGVSAPQVLAVQRKAGTTRLDASNTAFDLPDLAEGDYGFYTVVWKSDVANNDCFNPFDVVPVPSDIFSGQVYDQAHCYSEDLPGTPDVVVGIDNTKPNMRGMTVERTAVRAADGSLNSANLPVPSGTRKVQVTWNDDDNLSQIIGRDCSSDVSVLDAPPAFVVTPSADHPYRGCVSGQAITLTEGDGLKNLAVRLTDAAGNTDSFPVGVLVDTQAPATTGGPLTAPDRQNGWYSASPVFRLDGFDDGGGTGAASPPFEYQFDDSEVKGCTDGTATPRCTIDGSPGKALPGIGRHTLRWTGVDKVGNKDARRVLVLPGGNKLTVDDRSSTAFKIDGAAPTSALLSVPAAPNGANGWYSGPTWVTFGAFDQPGASGFKQAADDAARVAGVAYTITNGASTTSGTFDPTAPSPIRLAAGTSTVCWSAKDQAGNVEVADITTRCKTFKVDEADPTASLTPQGSATWSTATIPVTAVVQDGGSAGSGVGADADPSTVCAPQPTIAASAPSGTCISIDGSPFVTTVHDKDVWTLGEGLHEVRTFATDAAGRRSAIRTELYRVDLSNPVAVARVVPAQPASGKWYRENPTVVLRASDGDRQGAGVSAISYKVTGNTSTGTYTGPCSTTACTYTGPFTLPEGLFRVTYWATDRAGRTQLPQVLHIAVDTTTPVATATTPNPMIWLRSKLGLPLTSPTVDLRWKLSENLSGKADPDNSPADKVKVQVVVYDAMGYPVRTLDAGTVTVAPGTTYSGTTTWDGKGTNLALLPVGTYYYRVVATDAAGNQTESGESQRLLISLKLL